MILDQAHKVYPKECCGLLLGKKTGNDRYCHHIWPAENSWSPEIAQEFNLETLTEAHQHYQTDRYWIDPQDLLTAQKWGREQGQIIIGIYHSHPHHPAIPSENDRRWAWSDYVYFIVSLQGEQLLDYRCWILNENHQFEPEELLIPAQ